MASCNLEYQLYNVGTLHYTLDLTHYWWDTVPLIFLSWFYFWSHKNPVELKKICFANNQGALLQLSCWGCSTWSPVSGSLNERHSSLSHNLSCCYWLPWDSVNEARRARYRPYTHERSVGTVAFTASRCASFEWTLCSHNSRQVIHMSDRFHLKVMWNNQRWTFQDKYGIPVFFAVAPTHSFQIMPSFQTSSFHPIQT